MNIPVMQRDQVSSRVLYGLWSKFRKVHELAAHQLWSEKLGKIVHVEQPKVAKVQITGKPCNILS